MNRRKRGRIRERKNAAKKAAQHLPANLQDIVFAKFGRDKTTVGSFGAAGPVRRIDPAEYEGEI